MNSRLEKARKQTWNAQTAEVSSQDAGVPRQVQALLPASDPRFLEELGRVCLESKPMAIRAIRTVAPRLEAEDIYQFACLQTLRNHSHFRGEAKFSTWFVTIAMNCARTQRRLELSRAAKAHFFHTDEEGSLVRSQNESPEDRLLREERARQIFRAITKLSALSRRAVFAKYYCDMSVREIAALLGVSEAATKVRLFNARGMLRSVLRRAH